MSHHERIIYLLGYIKATIECLCSLASKDKSEELFNYLVEFEHTFNLEITELFPFE